MSTHPNTYTFEATTGGLVRLYYRFVLWTVAAALVLHAALHVLVGARTLVGPLVVALDAVILVLAVIGAETESPTKDTSERGPRALLLGLMGILLVVLCFETGGLASPFFLLVMLCAVFGALTLRPTTTFFLTAFLAGGYSFCAWVSPSEGLLHGGAERIERFFLTGRAMDSDEVTSLAMHCAFLFAGAWMSHRLSAGFRQKVTHFQDQANRDPLTKLPNRRAFLEKVRQEIDRAQRYRWPLAILIVDLDHFKRVNDTYGHPFGDAVLGQTAELLREAVGTIDHLARIGGEEFAVCAVGADPNHGGALAQQIVRRFRAHPWDRMRPELKVTCSVGVAVLHPRMQSTDPDRSLAFLLDQADKALYEVKETGRDNHRVASEAAPAPAAHTPA